MSLPEPSSLETDPRFPSGPWTGFFLQPLVPRRHWMELHLTFRQGEMTGEGRDWVGPFILRGRYAVADGKCHWTKRYLAKHDVYYQGFNEGKGIWGLWEIPPSGQLPGQRGGFHIWPEGMPDPTESHLTEQADLPLVEPVETAEPVAEPVASVVYFITNVQVAVASCRPALLWSAAAGRALDRANKPSQAGSSLGGHSAPSQAGSSPRTPEIPLAQLTPF